MWDILLIFALAFVSVLFLIYKLISPRRPYNFPSGPNGFPIIGSTKMVLDLSPRMPVALTKLGEKYGQVCGLYLGRYPCVIVNGWTAIQEVLSREEFENRPDLFLQADFWGNMSAGILLGNGHPWKEQRNFCMNTLRRNMIDIEAIIQGELKDLIQDLRNKLDRSSNSVVQMQDIFRIPVMNIMWALMSGRRRNQDDGQFLKIIGILESFLRTGIGLGSLINDWPFLRFIRPFSTEYNTLFENRAAINQLVKEEIKEHKLNRRKGGRPNHPNLIDTYLDKIEELKKAKTDISANFSEYQLVGICSDLLLTSTNSTSAILAFGILYMLSYPEIQETVQEELDNVLRHRAPTLQDRTKLPYTEAVLTELFRMCTPAPISVPHCTTVDTMLNGFNIPKNTVVNVNLHSVHKDGAFWENPETFRPERFLDADGKFVKPERVIPFGLGNRSCFGEHLASSLIFILFVGMLQNFEIERDMKQPKPTLEPIPRLVEAPRPFQAKLIFRR